LRKIKDKHKIFVIIVFVSIIFLPQIIFFVFKDKIDTTNTENRNLAIKPELSIATIMDFPKQYEAYYNDYVPFKNDLRRLWRDFNYNFLNATIDTRVIIGKERYFFYNSQERKDYNPISDAQGILRYSEKDRNTTINNLVKIAQEYKTKGIETHFLVIPNKETIYLDYLPEELNIKTTVTKMEDLMNYINEQDIKLNLYYPKEELQKARERDEIWYKYDTHYNKLGAFETAMHILPKMDKNFTYDKNSIKVNEVDIGKIRTDLARMANLVDTVEHNVARVVTGYKNNVTYTKIDDKNYKDILLKYYPREQVESLLKNYGVWNSNAQNKETLFVVGDSFSEDLKEYLIKNYKTVIVANLNYPLAVQDLIKKYNPNVMLFETTERYSNRLAGSVFRK
jgi:hypothetical protein